VTAGAAEPGGARNTPLADVDGGVSALSPEAGAELVHYHYARLIEMLNATETIECCWRQGDF